MASYKNVNGGCWEVSSIEVQWKTTRIEGWTPEHTFIKRNKNTVLFSAIASCPPCRSCLYVPDNSKLKQQSSADHGSPRTRRIGKSTTGRQCSGLGCRRTSLGRDPDSLPYAGRNTFLPSWFPIETTALFSWVTVHTTGGKMEKLVCCFPDFTKQMAASIDRERFLNC